MKQELNSLSADRENSFTEAQILAWMKGAAEADKLENPIHSARSTFGQSVREASAMAENLISESYIKFKQLDKAIQYTIDCLNAEHYSLTACQARFKDVTEIRNRGLALLKDFYQLQGAGESQKWPGMVKKLYEQTMQNVREVDRVYSMMKAKIQDGDENEPMEVSKMGSARMQLILHKVDKYRKAGDIISQLDAKELQRLVSEGDQLMCHIEDCLDEGTVKNDFALARIKNDLLEARENYSKALKEKNSGFSLKKMFGWFR